MDVGVSKFRTETEANDAKWQANLSQLIPCIVENGRVDYSGVEADVVRNSRTLSRIKGSETGSFFDFHFGNVFYIAFQTQAHLTLK